MFVCPDTQRNNAEPVDRLNSAVFKARVPGLGPLVCTSEFFFLRKIKAPPIHALRPIANYRGRGLKGSSGRHRSVPWSFLFA